MPPRRRAPAAPPPLNDEDVAGLRERLSRGATARVVVRTASSAAPAGTRGTVVRIGDASEAEPVVVRIGSDELPFALSELSIPGRRSARPAPAAAASTKASVTATAPTPARTPAPARTPPRPQRGARRTGSPLVVTLRFADGDWTVEATRGSRRVSRPSPLRPGAVSAFAEHVDDEAVREALVETVESCRAVVEQRAAALRTQLEQAEASLRDYDAAPSRRGRR